MVFAPALGVACLQVLSGLCFLVAVLSVTVVIKQWIAPNDGLDAATMVVVGGAFTLGGFACLWGARMIRRVVRGE
jgi:hypothetical protein